MRRIGRYILNGLTVLSVVLCVATVALWVRSYWVWDTVSHTKNWHPDPSGKGRILRASFLTHADGKITFESFWDRTTDAPLYEKMPGWRYERSTVRGPTPPALSIWNRLGLWVVRD